MAAQDKHFHIGIDVSKDRLDIHCLESGENWQCGNDKKDINGFARRHKEVLAQAFITIDSTGGHERLACDLLHQKGHMVHRAHSFRVKHFIRSMGQEAKTDRLDAIMLARYGFERRNDLRPYASESRKQRILKDLQMRRDDLVKMLTQERNRLAGPTSGVAKASFKAVIKTLEREVEKIEARIKKCIAEDEDLKAKDELLKSIKGIGEKTSHAILALMPEIGNLDRKQAAALAGLAPYARDSGKYRGYRSVKGGRTALRRALFLAALSAARFNTELKAFYQRLRANGKKPIVAITATARKLIIIANARTRDMKLS